MIIFHYYHNQDPFKWRYSL